MRKEKQRQDEDAEEAGKPPKRATTISLVRLDGAHPTAYSHAGNTRAGGGAILHHSMIKPVSAFGSSDERWRLTNAAARAFDKIQKDLSRLGVEPVRITDAWRDPQIQARLRAAYDFWVSRGKPDPGNASWDRRMRTAYAARAGESQHGWGAAVDIDVGALQMPDVARGSNAGLDLFWDVAKEHGFEPIISRPSAAMSECWHFEHLGPLRLVQQLFLDAGREQRAYRGIANAQTARAGIALAGLMPIEAIPGGNLSTAYIQARVTLGGHFCGKIDGIMGPKTIAVLRALNIGPESLGVRTPPEALFPELYDSKIAEREILEA